MKILVCYKYVPDESEISINPDRTLNTEQAPWVISPYDTNALEAAMKLAALEAGSSVEVLTVGGAPVRNTKMQKAVLSRGPSKMYAVHASECGGLYATARLLAQAIERIGPVDLVLCGDGSSDMYSQILGSMLASVLGWPGLNAVSSLTLDGDCVLAERTLGDRVETLRLSGPAVVSVSSDICRSRIPSMKDILGAGKKPVEIWDASSFSAPEDGVRTLSVLAPERTDRLGMQFRADADGLAAFAAALREQL